MNFPRTLALSLAALSVTTITPRAAHAITVECTLKDGSSCTVSNDPVDSTSCMCADESGTGTSGANDWADFDEEMLLEVCVSELELCSFAGTDSATTGVGTLGTDSTDSGGSGDDTGGEGTTTGGWGSTGDGSTGAGGTTNTSGAGSGGGPSTDPAATTGSSASGGDDGPAGTSSTDPAPSGESSGGAEATDEDPSGCSVDGNGHHQGALLAAFGLVLGLRRRRGR